MKTIEAFTVICTHEGKRYVWNGDNFYLEDGYKGTPKRFESKDDALGLVSRVQSADVEWGRPAKDLTIETTTKDVYEYVITGTDRNGKRFKIRTRTPQCYNVWRGNIWELNQDGTKRTLVKSIYN